jgi:hypothetical protein
MKKVIILTFILSTALLSESLTLKEYRELRKKTDESSRLFVATYISGIGEGISWVNSAMKNEYSIQFYCRPEDLLLTYENYLEMLDSAIKREELQQLIKEHQDKAILGLLLLKELQHIFPCEKK